MTVLRPFIYIVMLLKVNSHAFRFMNSPAVIKQGAALPQGVSTENNPMINHFLFGTRRPEHDIRPGEWIKTKKLNLPL